MANGGRDDAERGADLRTRVEFGGGRLGYEHQQRLGGVVELCGNAALSAAEDHRGIENVAGVLEELLFDVVEFADAHVADDRGLTAHFSWSPCAFFGVDDQRGVRKSAACPRREP